MKFIIVFIAVIVVSVISAIAHERDIYKTCMKKGNSGYAGWTIEITCSPKH